VERSHRKSAREAAAQQQAARQHKADLAAARKGVKDGSGAGGGKAGGGDTANRSSEKTAKDKTTERPGKGPRSDRTTLGQAVTEEAARRFGERRAEGLRHPWRADQDDPGPEPEQDADPAEKPDPPKTGSTGQAPQDGPAPGSSQEAPAGDPGTAPPPPGGAGASWTPPPGGGRRSAWESMRDAEAAAAGTVTVESLHVPGDSTRRARYARAATRGLPVAEPGTTTSTTTTTREAPVSAPVHAPGPAGTAAEHLTEITLDDVLDALASSKGQCFATYDQCAVLADQAVELRAALAELAEELAAHHNVVGRMTSSAMDRLAESMDVLARRAEEMRGESLHAAEAVETAHDAMHDAYRPVQQAAADAGLSMPSARIHNEE
jgi:hypothetical protein